MPQQSHVTYPVSTDEEFDPMRQLILPSVVALANYTASGTSSAVDTSLFRYLDANVGVTAVAAGLTDFRIWTEVSHDSTFPDVGGGSGIGLWPVNTFEYSTAVLPTVSYTTSISTVVGHDIIKYTSTGDFSGIIVYCAKGNINAAWTRYHWVIAPAGTAVTFAAAMHLRD